MYNKNMTKKFYKNEKFQTWFFSILYFLMAVAVIITGCFTFKKAFYLPIVVSGTSMWPTLAGGSERNYGGYSLRNYYGIADIHRSSVETLHRFDVIATYYPSDWGTKPDYKIKRVWGFPGETINLSYDYTAKTYTFEVFENNHKTYSLTSLPLNENYHMQTEGAKVNPNGTVEYKTFDFTFSVHTFVLPNKTFNVSYVTPETPSPDIHIVHNKKLDDNEYFVMGDNFAGSTDSYDYYDDPTKTKLTKDYLQGRIICINSYVSYINNVISSEHPIEKRYEF